MKRRLFVLLTVVAALAAGAAGGWLYYSREAGAPPASPAGAETAPAPAFWSPHELIATLGEPRGRHWGMVYGVAISPDGKRLASGGYDGYVRFWDGATLEPAGALSPESYRHVYGVAYSPDGRLLAVSDDQKAVEIWDVTTDPPRRQTAFNTGGGRAKRVAFLGDGRTLATWDGLFGEGRLWDLTADPPRPRELLPAQQSIIAFSPDGKRVATAGAARRLQVWDVLGDKAVARPDSPVLEARAQAVAFGPDGRVLAAVFGFFTSEYVALWDLAVTPPKARSVRSTHASLIETLAFAPDGRTLATAGFDGTVRLWDVTADPPREAAVLKGHRDHVTALAFSRDGKTLVSGSRDKTVRAWDLAANPPAERPPPRDQPHTLSCVAITPDGKRLAVGAHDHRVWLWDLGDDGPRERAVLTGHTGIVNSVAFSPDGKALASAGSSEDFTARLWDVAAEKPAEKAVLRGHKAGLGAVAFSPDGKLLATASQDKTIRLWRLSAGAPELLAVLEGHKGPVESVAFSPDGKVLVSAALGAAAPLDAMAARWDLSAPRRLIDDPPADPPPLPLRLGPERLVEGVVSYPAWVGFSGDGKTVALSGRRTVRLWSQGGPLGEWRDLSGDALAADALAFAPNRPVLATADFDRRLTFWDAGAGAKLQQWQLPGPVEALAFAASGDRLAVVNGNDTVSVLRLRWEKRPAAPLPPPGPLD